MTDGIPDGECHTCGQSHRQLASTGVLPKHPFNDGTLGASATFGKRRPDGQGNAPVPVAQFSSHPFDPVLRQALIDKGVLTPQDLRDAESKISAITGFFHMKGESGDGTQ